MEDSKILEIIYTWQTYLRKKELFDRDLLGKLIDNIGKEIVDITGIRRCGKSSLLNLLMRQINVPDSQILYINFEDPMFANDLNIELMEKIWEVYRIKINPDKKPYIFFDEIQLIPKWEKWIRKIRDLELGYIFITGSSSKIISREFGTALTGRHISFTLFPLNFKEFLRFKGFNILYDEKEIIKNTLWLRKYFEEYLIKGGFPEIVLTDNEELLKNYFEDILYKDVILRHEIRDVNLLRRLANYCLTNLAQQTSINSLKNTFKVSFDAVRSYLNYLVESFIIFQISIFSYSLKVQEINPKKIYCIDNGLRNAVSFKFSKDEGKLVENVVFLELKRKNKEIYYWQGKNEVDFVIKEIDGSLTAMNVTYTDEINLREIQGLKEFKEKYTEEVKRLIIITKNIEKQEEMINYLPVWKWLLR